jgi:hypothetical protein
MASGAGAIISGLPWDSSIQREFLFLPPREANARVSVGSETPE